MSRVFWLCQLVENPVGSNMWEPAIISVLSGVGEGMPKLRWSPTDAIRSVKYAVGCGDFSANQIAAVNAVNTIQMVQESIWFSTFGQLPAGVQNRIRTLLTSAGIAIPSNGEVLRDLFSRINQIIDNKTIDDNLAAL